MKKGEIMKTRTDPIQRPNDSVVEGFLAEVRATPEELVAMADDPELVEFDSDVVGSERYGQTRAYGMLRAGDFLDVSIAGEWVHLGFCGHDLGLINREDRIGYNLSSIVGNAEAYGLSRGRVFARVERIVGDKMRPKALLHVFYVMDLSKQRAVNGILLTQDGKTVIKQVDDTLTALDVPEGVEEIAPRAFEGRPISVLHLPSTLKAIGDGAFAGTRVAKVRIPASVDNIGVGAFSLGFTETSTGGPSWVNHDAPTYFEVEEGNPFYKSEGGSLIEMENGDVTLKSAYYDPGPNVGFVFNSEPVDVEVPYGVTRIAPMCMFGLHGRWVRLRLHFPETLKTIDEDAVSNANVAGFNVPKYLTDVAHDFWRYAIDGDLPNLYSGPYCTGDPIAEFNLDPKVDITVDSENPRYSVSRGRFMIASDWTDLPYKPVSPSQERSQVSGRVVLLKVESFCSAEGDIQRRSLLVYDITPADVAALEELEKEHSKTHDYNKIGFGLSIARAALSASAEGERPLGSRAISADDALSFMDKAFGGAIYEETHWWIRKSGSDGFEKARPGDIGDLDESDTDSVRIYVFADDGSALAKCAASARVADIDCECIAEL